MSIRLVIIGPPGVGKGTQANILKEQYNIPHLSTGKILREEIKNNSEIGKIAKDYIDKGLLVPDQYLIEIIKSHIIDPECNNGYILDGFPRTLIQADDFNQLLNEINQRIDLVINLTANENELVSRLIKRSKNSGRSDDIAEVIMKRQKIYWEKTAPIIDYYKKLNIIKEIDGLGTISEISERIFTEIN